VKRKTYVKPSGDKLNCKITFVGEQPGKREVRRGEPFCGPAGDELHDCCRLSRILKSECYYTNVVKDLDYPIHDYISIDKNNNVHVFPEGEEYIAELKEELQDNNANVIVAVGNVALYALTDRVGIHRWRSSIINSTLLPGRKVIPIIHPSTVIKPKYQYLNKHLIVMDLKRVKEQSSFPEINLTPRNVITKPSFNTIIEYLNMIRKDGLMGSTVYYDIELYNLELGCISFATLEEDTICIPFVDSSGDYFPPDQEISIMKMIELILSDKRIHKVGHNIIFDSHFLLRKYGIRSYNMGDTMVAQKILFQDYLVRLEFPTAMYTDMNYYKDDGKLWIYGANTGWEQGWMYNGYDSLACATILPKQLKDLTRQENDVTYKRQTRIIPPLTYMMEKGIRVDLNVMKKLADEQQAKVDKMQEELNKLAGFEFNPNSPKQVGEYFYVKKGLKAYKKRGGGVTTDERALKRVFRKGYHEARLILDIRSAVKLKSTYLNSSKVDSDSRIRCSYNPVGTRFSRISSSKSIFGTGMNMQNWPHELMSCLLADEGYVFYSYDMSQFENRIVAYVGNIVQMIHAFENGIDVHRLTASLIFGKPIDEVTTEDGSCPLSGGRFSERYWGKKSNHALNYDEGYKTFSLDCEIPEREGKWMHNRYHAMYPGVRENFHTMIRAQLAKNRTLTNLYNRKTLFLDMWGDKLFKAGYSCIPQGTCGDHINERGLNYIYYNQDQFRLVELMTQVHDSVGFQIPLSIPWYRHAQMLVSIKDNLETPLRWKDREFVIPADLTIGLNLNKNEGIEIDHKEFPKNIHSLAVKLEESYQKLRR